MDNFYEAMARFYEVMEEKYPFQMQKIISFKWDIYSEITKVANLIDRNKTVDLDNAEIKISTAYNNLRQAVEELIGIDASLYEGANQYILQNVENDIVFYLNRAEEHNLYLNAERFFKNPQMYSEPSDEKSKKHKKSNWSRKPIAKFKKQYDLESKTLWTTEFVGNRPYWKKYEF